MNTSEPKIIEFLANVGIPISARAVSNLLIKDQEIFHAEKEAVCEAGLRSSPWQHINDTQTRVNGQNQHCHAICNPVYTAYHTLPNKNRLAVLDVLRNGRERSFRLNQEAMAYLETDKLLQDNCSILRSGCSEQDQDEATFLT
ncbi:MAG: hypothetical protein JXB07_19970 [Anaerolineae bacterium]|nr:hypothetical protein [Anaerolineae bacterium]